MEINTRACVLFTFDSVGLLCKDECKIDVESGVLLRILTPLVKLFTAKLCVALTSEGLECFGGVGFCEDSFLPVILRDSQVLPIWVFLFFSTHFIFRKVRQTFYLLIYLVAIES